MFRGKRNHAGCRQASPSRSQAGRILRQVKATTSTDRLLDGLTDVQALAVTSTATPLCVVASAGAGKTRVVTRRIAYRCETGSSRADHTLALTFTKKAASELQQRISDLRSDSSDAAKVTAGTFHSVALAQLRGWWRDRRSPPRVLVESKLALIGPLLAERTNLRAAPAVEVARAIEWAKARAVTPEALVGYTADARSGTLAGLDVELVASLYSRYEHEKRKRGLIDFDDLLWLCVDAMERDPEFAAAQRWRWSHVYVDEYQDLNPLQFKLLRAWLGPNTDLCAVGDPNQAIYAWNGSDRTLLERFCDHWPSAEVLRLDANHRSSRQIVSAAAAALGSAGAGLTSTGRDGPSVKYLTYRSGRAEARGAASTLLGAKRSGRPWRSMAVLARTNSQLVEIAQSLDLLEVPYRIAGDEGSPSALNNPAAFDSPAAFDTVDDQANPGAPDGAVTLSSFHRAKGLEWDFVMLVGLEEGLVPFGRATTREQTDEERRLLYVAMTRAVEELHLSWAKVRYFTGRPVERQPCRWLDELDRSPAPADLSPLHARPSAPPGTRPRPEGLPSGRRRSDPDSPSALLRNAITAWRRDTARFSGVVAHLLLHDATIDAIAESRPTSIEELAAVRGVGPVKAHRYGPQILKLLVPYDDAANQ